MAWYEHAAMIAVLVIAIVCLVIGGLGIGQMTWHYIKQAIRNFTE